MGRMGQQLIKSSKKNNNFKLVTLTENRLVNKKFNGIKPELNSDKAFKKTDVIIIAPPTKLMNVGCSLKNNQTQIGASENSRRLNNVISAANK